MIQATTPALILTLPDTVDLTEADEIYVTLRQEPIELTKTLGSDVWLFNAYTIQVALSQAETLAFKPGRVIEVQVNWITNGTREATLIAYLNMSYNLIPEVIEL